ncbi:MAG: ChrB domain-containing protein, partial [Anaerolineae bacterium]
MKWLLFLPQLPALPSTLRVMVWRRMRAIGALGLQNGVWVLPHTPEKEQFVEELLAYVQEQGANGYIFEVGALNQSIEDTILMRFRADRDEEYAEFCERCDALLAELEKETRQKKFTFAELEETEEDLQKLNNWWDKINARDFVGGNRRQEAMDRLERCRKARLVFVSQVYQCQGIEADDSLDEQ